MPEGRLVIGTKRYSSWSMRGWLAVHLAGLDVEEVLIPLAGGGATTALKLPASAGCARASAARSSWRKRNRPAATPASC